MHIRQCGLVNPVIISNHLRILKFSLCNTIELLKIKSPSVQVVELYECEIQNTPLFNTKNLEKLLLHKCTKLTDTKFQQIMLQFNHTPEHNAPNNSLKAVWVTECTPLSNPVIACDTLKG